MTIKLIFLLKPLHVMQSKSPANTSRIATPAPPLPLLPMFRDNLVESGSGFSASES